MSSADVLQFVLSGVTNGSVYAIVALSFTIIFNATGVVNFAQGEFAMVAGLSAASLVASGLPLPLAALCAIALTALVGAIVFLATVAPIPRATHFMSIAVTLGVSIVLQKLAQFAWGTDAYMLPGVSRRETLHVAGATITPQAVFVLAASALLMALLYAFFKHTRAGQAVLACSENAEAAGLVGIDVPRTRGQAYVLGCALGAIAGILVMPLTTMSNTSGLVLTIKGFSAAVLGGFGSSAGAVIGGLVLGVLESLSAGLISSSYQNLVALVAVVLILMFRSGGLLGTRVLH
jgi:branched-chain amino acid transport system permease protein